jgi:tetratricopeptide (TPR) repeat protein
VRLYEERLVIEREIGNDEGMANAILGIGTIQYSTYDYGAALRSYRDALAIQEKLNDEVLIGTTLISTGNVLYLQGDFEGAIADYRRAEALKRKNYDVAGAVNALEGLGRVYFAQGDYAAALGAFDGVLHEWRRFKATARQALVLQHIGETHFRLGNNDQARAAFEQSRKDFESVKDIGNAGRVLQGGAVNELVMGRFPAAEQAYTDSIALCTSAKDAECIARGQVGLAFALAAQRRFDDAITWYRRSLISFNDLRMEEAAARARIGLAEAFYGKGEFEKALEEAINARRTGVALASDDLLWRALVSQAQAERKLANPMAALGTARAALLAVQRMAATALDRPDQAVPRDTTAAFATVALLQAEAGDAASAYVTAEQMRAHALRAWLAPNERDIARGMTGAERDEERKLAMELMSLLVKRDRQKDLPKPDATIIEKLDASIKEMTAQRTAARLRLFARLPDLRTWRALDQPATADDLTLLLDSPDKVLLEFVVDEHDVVIIVASRGEPGESPPQISTHVVPIERQALADRIVRVLDGKVLATVDAWRKGSAELFHLLPSDVVDRLTAAKSIVVSPDDVLWRVPFEAMPVTAVEAGFSRRDLYLADRATVTYTTSVGAAVRVPAAPAVDPKAPVIAVASPQLAEGMLETLKATSPTWMIRRAETANTEVERITRGASEPGPIVLSGVEATRDRLMAARKSIGPLHIAAPFRVNSAGPLFSPILLAAPESGSREPEAGRSQNPEAGSRKPEAARSLEPEAGSREPEAGKSREPEAGLEARDLFKMDPLASAVMFSDPAALSKRDAAAAAGIVHWAWRSSGTTSVIFRRWGGEDASATEVIGNFYEELRAGKSAPEALEAARATVRATESGRAPGAWAGWLVFAGR